MFQLTCALCYGSDPSVKALLSQIEKDEQARSAKADNKLRGFLNK